MRRGDSRKSKSPGEAPPVRSGRHRAKQGFLRRTDRRYFLRSSRVSNGEPTEVRDLGPRTLTANRQITRSKPLHNDMFLRRTDRIRAALDCSKFVRTYGEPTELPTENEIHEHPGSETPTANRRKAENLGAERVKRTGMHSAFGSNRDKRGGVHSRLVAARRVQGVGGSVTFTRRPPPAKIGEWPR